LPLHPPPLKFTAPAPHQISRRISKTKPFKAPGEDGIPNVVLKECSAILTLFLHTGLNAILSIGYFPRRWRTWKTIVLRKPGRPDYMIAEAYRPIAIYNTMGKVLSGVMTDITVYLTVRHNLLPPRHFGGLPNRTTVDSLLYLTHRVKEAWHKRKVVTVIFLDIANAFPTAVTEHLLKNMARLGYPMEIIGFFEAMLKDRKTKLSFDDFTSLPLEIDNGIGQGETASMILYLIYSYGLVAIPKGRDEDGGTYVDDNFFVAIADTFDDCDVLLNDMLDKQTIWLAAHNSQAEISKFQCLRLTRRKDMTRTDFIHRQTHQVVSSVKEACLLGVQIDQELWWHQHAQQAVQKSENLLLAVNRLTRPSFGLPERHVRRLYISMILPKLEYTLPVWYTPIHEDPDTGRRTGSRGHTKILDKVQRLGCKLITGAYRSTATDVLELHAMVPPTQLCLDDTCHREALRLAMLPKSHPLHKAVNRSARRRPRSHPSPIHNLLWRYKIRPATIETINSTRHHPSW
jgi:Reverse transcriptase (RNA-dependent DNA polymerase)